MLSALTLGLLCGLGWVAATWRAPRAGAFVEPPSSSEIQPVPAVLPRRRAVPAAGAVATVLAVMSIGSVFVLALRPDGEQGRTLYAIQEAGARVAKGTVEETSEGESTGVGRGKRASSYHYADMRVRLTDGTVLAVDRGIVAGLPSEGDLVDVLYAPGRPELGGRVDDGTDLTVYVSAWRPLPGMKELAPFLVLTFPAGLALVTFNGLSLSSRGARRLLAEDAAAGEVYAMEVRALTPYVGRQTIAGARADTGARTTDVQLWARCADRLVTLRVGRADVLGLASEFGASGGRLVWARRWTVSYGRLPVPGVFVAPDGRTFACEVARADLRRCVDLGLAGIVRTGAGLRGRPFEGVCRTSAVGRLGIVAVWTAVAASTLPVLTGTSGYLTGYLPLPLALLAAVATAWYSRTAWRRTTRAADGTVSPSQDPHVPA
jgi:hypothetical protein